MDGNGGKEKGAVKIHTLLDLRGNIPAFIHISDGKMNDVCAMDHLPIEASAFYIMDRGYHDFRRLYRFTKARAFFVTRPRSNTKYRRLYSLPCERILGVLCDQTIVLSGVVTRKTYPEKLRRIRYQDPQTHKRLVFITNNFDLSASAIAQLYRSRWQVELFFKWIKQHLRIKRFYGRTDNAVKTQIWIAVAAYVLAAIVKKRLDIPQSLYTILQVVSVAAFEKTPILSAFQRSLDTNNQADIDNQLDFFKS
jgi:IS4 transposase